MNAYDIIIILIFLSALFAYVNSKLLRLPPTIGLMSQAFVASLILIGLNLAGVPGIESARTLLGGIDFNRVLFNGLLSFLLFAGALKIGLGWLRAVKTQVLALATLGVLGSTVIVGFLTYALSSAFGLGVPLGYCLLFGALISPTDPIAVLPIIRRAKVTRNLETLIAGESLFNDGFAVVIFAVLLRVTVDEESGSIPLQAAILFGREAVGGLVFGLVLGYLGYRVIRTIDDYPVEILITLALVAGGYAVAETLGISGPLATVVAGIIIGNRGRAKAMSARTSENLDRFWEMVDTILNAALFVLIGLEAVIFASQFSAVRLVVALLTIPIVLLARLLSTGLPILAFKPVPGTGLSSLPLVTWAGLRGAIPIALVLSLPIGPNRDMLATMTYVVVVFSVLVQGLTVTYFARLARPRAAKARGKGD
jgi:CPA1 family monovalent cation:H+ antiporter